MVSLTSLWLPILLSAVFVFVASSILHMVLTYHRGDYLRLADEESVLAALRAADVKRGLYMFPFGTHKEMKSPAMIEKYKQGPVGLLTIFPTGPVNMPKYLGMWFVYCVVVSLFTAYLSGRTVPPAADFLAVCRVAGTTSFMAYGVGQLTNGIWMGQPWSVTIKHVIDGFVFGLITALTFAWLWPH